MICLLNVSQPGKHWISDGFKRGSGSEGQNCPAPDLCSLQKSYHPEILSPGPISDHRQCFTLGRKWAAAENLAQRSAKIYELHFSLSNFRLLLSPFARPLGTGMDIVLEELILGGLQAGNAAAVMWSAASAGFALCPGALRRRAGKENSW